MVDYLLDYTYVIGTTAPNSIGDSTCFSNEVAGFDANKSCYSIYAVNHAFGFMAEFTAYVELADIMPVSSNFSASFRQYITKCQPILRYGSSSQYLHFFTLLRHSIESNLEPRQFELDIRDLAKRWCFNIKRLRDELLSADSGPLYVAQPRQCDEYCDITEIATKPLKHMCFNDGTCPMKKCLFIDYRDNIDYHTLLKSVIEYVFVFLRNMKSLPGGLEICNSMQAMLKCSKEKDYCDKVIRTMESVKISIGGFPESNVCREALERDIDIIILKVMEIKKAKTAMVPHCNSWGLLIDQIMSNSYGKKLMTFRDNQRMVSDYVKTRRTLNPSNNISCLTLPPVATPYMASIVDDRGVGVRLVVDKHSTYKYKSVSMGDEQAYVSRIKPSKLLKEKIDVSIEYLPLLPRIEQVTAT